VSRTSLKLVVVLTFPVFTLGVACGGNEPTAQSPTSAAASPAVSSRPAVTATQPTGGTGSTPVTNAEATPTPGGSFEVAIAGVKSPADIGYDTKRSRVLVPLFEENAVEVFELK
jgi:hypothetical protein